MHESIMNERVWTGTKSNPMRLHAFLSGQGSFGPAVCHRGIKAGTTGNLASIAEKVPVPSGLTFCPKCADLVLSMVNRREASMQPSTGEGDYLPPAKQQCTWCRGDYSVKKDGVLRSHECWTYRDGSVVYGPLDRHGRGKKSEPVEEAVPVAAEEPTMPVNQHGEPLAFDPAKPETQAMLNALFAIRAQSGSTTEEALSRIVEAFDVLDNAGLFDGLDEAACYDNTPFPVPAAPVSLCGTDGHMHVWDCLPEQRSGRWAVTNPPRTTQARLRRASGLRLVQGGRKPQCGGLDWAGDRCGLDSGHASACMH